MFRWRCAGEERLIDLPDFANPINWALLLMFMQSCLDMVQIYWFLDSPFLLASQCLFLRWFPFGLKYSLQNLLWWRSVNQENLFILALRIRHNYPAGLRTCWTRRELLMCQEDWPLEKQSKTSAFCEQVTSTRKRGYCWAKHALVFPPNIPIW